MVISLGAGQSNTLAAGGSGFVLVVDTNVNRAALGADQATTFGSGLVNIIDEAIGRIRLL